MLQPQDSLDRTPRYGTYSKAYPQVARSKPTMSPVTWLLLLASLVLAAAAGGRILQARRSSRQPPVLYAVVIDSGSSGTRIYAYNWTQPHPHSSSSSAGLPVVRPIPASAAPHLVPQHAQQGMYSRVETRPGLDTFAGNTSGLGTALGPLLAWARGVVPAALQPSTPLFLMGTGGLRRLPGQQQAALLTAIRQLLAHSGFRFEANWARVISGDDEGALAWLALNYQQGRLGPHSSSSSSSSQAAASGPAAAGAAGTSGVPGSITSSLGVLDLGGSSLQVTFQVPTVQASTVRGPAGFKDSSSPSSSEAAATAPAASPVSPQYNLSVAGHTFQLHLHSFKQYGLNEAYDRSITLLLSQQQEQQRQHKPDVQQQQQQQQQQQLGHHSEQVSMVPSSQAQAATSDADNTAGSTPTASVPLPSAAAAAAAAGAAVEHDIAVAGAAGIHPDLPSAAAGSSTTGSSTSGSSTSGSSTSGSSTSGSSTSGSSTSGSSTSGSSRASSSGSEPTPAPHPSTSPAGHTSITPESHTVLTPGSGPGSATASSIPASSRAAGDTLSLAGSSSHAGLQAGSSSVDYSNALHSSSSSSSSSSSHASLQAVSKPADPSALHSSSSSSSGNNHRGLQALPHHAAAQPQQQQQQQTAHQPPGTQHTKQGAHWELPGQHPQHLHAPVPAAVGVSAAVRRRASGVLRRSLLQQQLAWLEQLLGPAQHPQGVAGTQDGRGHHTSSFSGISSSNGGSRGHQRVALQRHSHDIRLRQLLREYLLREDTAVAGAPLLPRGANSTTGGAAFVGGGSSLATGLPAVAPGTAGGSSSSELDGAPAVVPIDAGSTPSSSTSSSSSTPAAVAPRAPGVAIGSSSSSSNGSTQLAVVSHPCLHEGYQGVYSRVAYGGVTPQPGQVLLRGAPDWPACLGLVTRVVNASAPCGVHEHAPACVLGTPQPELQGGFMAITGFYVVSKFLGVQGSSSGSLEPLLGAAKTLCARPWPWVQLHLGHNVNVERYCTWGPYVATLLLRGLGLGEQRVVIAQDGGVGWPLGAVLVEASKLPGFCTGMVQGSGAQQQRRQQKIPHRHGKQGKGSQKARESSLRGTGVLRQEQQPAAATPAGLSQGHGGGSSTSSSQQQQQPPLPHLQHQHQAAVQGAAAGAAAVPSPDGPAWSLGLLHHNESSPGLHLSGFGWGAVLGVAWVVLVGWARGVCGSPKAPAGSAGAFLPLTGPLGGVGAAGHGRAHGRSKISPNRSSFRSLKS